jgi:dienelactone hydrolase
MATLHATEQLMGDVREVRFAFDLAGETVPGLLYMPAEWAEPMPLVVIQHPGMGSKDDYFVAEVGRQWARRGWAVAGLDAPMHGDRAEHDPMRLFREPARFPEIRARFAGELSAAIDLLAEHYPIDVSRLGFVGYSMGSMLGIPAVARDGRFKAAAFCLVGEGGLVGEVAGPEADIARLATVAVRVVGKLQDQLIPRAATEALYAALPGPKEIAWFPGGHFEIGPDVVDAAGNWMKAKL